MLFVRRAQRDGREVVQQGDVVFDAQLHHRRFLLAADGFNAAIKLFGDLGYQETFGEQAQHFALFRRQAFIAIAAGADFFQQARDAFRGEFLPFLQRGQRFWQVGRRPLLEDDPFDIQIQHRAEDRRIVVHGQNNDRQIREVALDVFNQRDPVAVFITGHGQIGDQHMGVQLRKIVDKGRGVFKLANDVHPLNLLK